MPASWNVANSLVAPYLYTVTFTRGVRHRCFGFVTNQSNSSRFVPDPATVMDSLPEERCYEWQVNLLIMWHQSWLWTSRL